jgi:membrane protein
MAEKTKEQLDGSAGPSRRFSRDRAPEGPTDLTRRSWIGVLKRSVSEFKEDNLTDWAAALTYYGILSIFPALLVLVSVLGLIGSSATQPLIDNLGKVAPGPAQDIFTSAIKNLQGSGGAAGVFFVIGLAGALWSASGYVAAFMRASHVIYDIEEGRPVWKTLPTRVILTLVLLVLLAVSAVAVTLTGGLAKEVGGVLGLSDTAITVWNIAKWPALLVMVSLMFGLLYWAAPNVRHPKFRWVTPGGVLAVVAGSSPRWHLRCMSRTSAPTTRPMARWRARSCSWSGCGSRTSWCCSAPK